MRGKKIVGLIALLIIAFATVGYCISKVYWQRQLQREIVVTGIEAELLIPTMEGFATKTVATSLTNDQVILTIYKENYYNIWLNITYISDAPGLIVTATGQYYRYYMGMSTWVFAPEGGTFNVLGFNEIDKTKMMWNIPGYCMMITFGFNTEGVTSPGTYAADLTFQIGFS